MRQSQRDYAAMATHAFEPRERKDINNILLAEAGTGLGKTLGYLAPSYLWARKNNAPVWISTYTKNLQRQLDQETARLVQDPAERRERIVIRKGRENYACLLNMQEVFGRLTGANARSALLAALIARWARFSRDGDIVGGDFPSWLLSLFQDVSLDGEGRGLTPAALGLTDRRGECIYAGCTHYKRCFIERSVRAGRNADIVIANHALVLHQAAIDQAIGVAKTPDEEAAPGFNNYRPEQLPIFTDKGIWMRLIAGNAYGLNNDVKTNSPLFYLHVVLEAGTKFSLPKEHPERAIYIVKGSIEAGGNEYKDGQMLVFTKGADPIISAKENSTIMLLGGEPLGERFIWWNFVSSRKERIEQAKEDWKQGRIILPPNDNKEFIPLPEDKSKPAGGPPPGALS